MTADNLSGSEPTLGSADDGDDVDDVEDATDTARFAAGGTATGSPSRCADGSSSSDAGGGDHDIGCFENTSGTPSSDAAAAIAATAAA
jgi:hypothetical protein